MRTFLVVMLATLACAMYLCAAGIDGVWKADYTAPDGNTRQSTFHLKADGEKLTGTVVGQSGEAALKDGLVKGDEVSFSVTRNFNGQEFTLKYTGKVEGDQLKLKVLVNENSFDMVAKRQ